MASADGRFWITFNGEIYNFLELRRELVQRGHSFRTDTDTEVILAAYQRWGIECQLRFNGMWAFAIWDAVEHVLFLSRDRFGVKPLYYAEAGGQLAFASELRSFLHLPWCNGHLDDELLAEVIWNPIGLDGTEHTLLPQVRQLLGGHCMIVTRSDAQVRRWWDTHQHLPSVPEGLLEQSQEFRALFLDACRLRLRSDVSIATSLSGGLDSSAIACSVAALARDGVVEHAPEDWQQAFIACFPETSLDERSFADKIVGHTGIRAHHHTVDDTIAVREIEQVVFDLEGVFSVPLVGAWAIYREMRRAGIRVSLDGHGADELLGGYHFFVDGAIAEPPATHARWRDLQRVRAGMNGGVDLRRSGALLEGCGMRDTARLMARFGLAQVGLLDRVVRIRDALTERHGAAPIIANAALPPFAGEKRLAYEDWKRRPGQSTLGAMLDFWFHNGFLPTFLRCIDRAAMAHGVEVRMPFMDWRVAAFCFALPDESKIGGGYTKRLLRLAMDGLMPDAVRLRTCKTPFSSPVAEWTRGALRTWLSDTVASRAFLDGPCWNGLPVKAEVEAAISGRGNIRGVWPVINAHVLRQKFRESARALRAPEPEYAEFGTA